MKPGKESHVAHEPWVGHPCYTIFKQRGSF